MNERNILAIQKAKFYRDGDENLERAERARCVTRSNNGCEKDYAYYRFSNREKINIFRLQLIASKI